MLFWSFYNCRVDHLLWLSCFLSYSVVSSDFIFVFYLLPPPFFLPVPHFCQVLLGFHNAAVYGGQSDHHPSGHHLLQGRNHHTLDHLQRGVWHLLSHGPGAELSHRNHHRGQLRHYFGPWNYKEEIFKDLVHCWLYLFYPSGLHFPYCRKRNRLGSIQDCSSLEDCPIHQDLKSSEASEALPINTLHPPMGRGKDHLVTEQSQKSDLYFISLLRIFVAQRLYLIAKLGDKR